ncbi:MAG: NUDIX domain-containing protein [Bacilli bacterium]|nr:NUDIX domain-containing protein [Bacilli bacterium]
MEYSSGIILYRKNSDNVFEFFVCTPDGPMWINRELWNFPKGHLEINESPFKAAIREFEEETSVKLNDEESLYKFHGIIKQNKHKRVFVYSKKYENEDLSNCYSNECITIYKEKLYVHNEIKDYRWMTFEELENKGMKCYLDTFKEIINSND